MIHLPGDTILRILFVLVLVTAAFIITRRNINSLFLAYLVQSLFISVIAFILYLETGSAILLWISLLTLVSKVLILPYFLGKIRDKMKIRRDIEFHYLSPTGSIFVSIFMVIVTYSVFSKFISSISESSLFLLGTVIGISLTFMGMLVMFSRKKAVTKIVGYLTMENGVLLFSLFFPELPFIIEILIIIDLIILVLLSTIMALGIDSTIEEFHNRLNRIDTLIKGDKR